MNSSGRQAVQPVTALEMLAACASFAFYKTTRRLLRWVARWHFSRNPALARRWRILSAEGLAMPLALPVVMTSAPRWNTHAIIGSAGPLHVARSIRVNSQSACKSAKAWTIVVYEYPCQKTVAHIGSAGGRTDEPWQEIELAPGTYTLILRYYHWTGEVEFPAVSVDGVDQVASRAVPADVNKFYRELPKRANRFYTLLHYYVFTILRCTRWLPSNFIRREFLPVENPETTFYYDAVEQGRRVHFHVKRSVLESFDVLYTLYGRDSFPLEWSRIESCEYTTVAAHRNGFYLVRVHRVDPAAQLDAAGVEISVR